MPVFPFSSSPCGRNNKANRPNQPPSQKQGWHAAAVPPNSNIQPPYGMNVTSPPPEAMLSPPPQYPGWTASPPQPPQQQFNYPLQNVKWASTSNVHQLSPQQNANWKSSVSLPASLPSGLHGAAISVTSLPDTANCSGGNGNGFVQQGVGLFNAISSKFDSVISCIDEEVFSGQEADLSTQTNIVPQSREI